MRSSVRAIAAVLTVVALHATSPAHAQWSDMAIKVFCNTPRDFLAGYGDRFAVVTPPEHGTATFADNHLLYVPAPGYSGLDRFQYQYYYLPTDEVPTEMLVYVTVGDCALPVAQDASFDAAYETATPLTLTATDPNPGGPFQFSYAIDTAPAHGHVEIEGDVATYTPSPGYSGADAFTFTASTVDGTSEPAQVSVTVGTSPARLTLSVDDGRDAVRYGTTIDYIVTLTNDGGSAASGVSTEFSLSGGFDGNFLHLFCYGAGSGASCAQNPLDPLHFTIALPSGRSLVWLAEVVVRADAEGATVDFGATAGAAASSVDSDVLVIHRDGFDASYGDDEAFRRVLEKAVQALRRRSGEGGDPAADRVDGAE